MSITTKMQTIEVILDNQWTVKAGLFVNFFGNTRLELKKKKIENIRNKLNSSVKVHYMYASIIQNIKISGMYMIICDESSLEETKQMMYHKMCRYIVNQCFFACELFSRVSRKPRRGYLISCLKYLSVHSFSLYIHIDHKI